MNSASIELYQVSSIYNHIDIRGTTKMDHDYFEIQTDDMLEDMFNEWIDETSQPIVLLGTEYSTGEVLKKIDPIKYQCDLSDWIDHAVSDGYLIHGDDGEYYVEL